MRASLRFGLNIPENDINKTIQAFLKLFDHDDEQTISPI